MKWRYTFFILVLGVILMGCDKQPKEKIWIENAGYVIIEAENGNNYLENLAGWKFSKSLQGYTGSGYCTWLGENDWGKESRPYEEIEEQHKILSFKVQINNPGDYFIKLRNVHMKTDGDNDVWASVDQSKWTKMYDHQTRTWTWDETGRWAKYKLENGISVIQLAGRSNGFSVDRVVLHRDGLGEKIWGSKDKPESPTLKKIEKGTN